MGTDIPGALAWETSSRRGASPVLLSASPWMSSSGFLILSAWVKGLILVYVSRAWGRQEARGREAVGAGLRTRTHA